MNKHREDDIPDGDWEDDTYATFWKINVNDDENTSVENDSEAMMFLVIESDAWQDGYITTQDPVDLEDKR